MNKVIVSALAVVLLVPAACSRDESVTTIEVTNDSAGSSTTTLAPVSTTMPEISTTAETSPVDSDSSTTTDLRSTTAPAPATTTTAVPPTTAPPATTVPPPTTIAATLGTAVAYVGGSLGAWAPIGWWDGAMWQQPGWDEAGDPIEVPAPSSDDVSVTGLDVPGAPIRGLSFDPAGPDYYCVGDEVGPIIDVGVEIPEPELWSGFQALAVSGDWDIQPRPVDQVGLDALIYQEIGESMVPEGPGVVPTNGDVVQVVRADLDGNGVEEVLFTFEYQSNPEFGAEGDFSLVIARYPSEDGSVVDELLFGYLAADPTDFPTPGRGTLLGIADLNGDAIMEVVLRSVYWETALADLWVWADGRLVLTSTGGCGV